MIPVKICGLTEPSALQAAHQAGVQWVGLVFFPPSPRAVSIAQAAPLARLVQGLTHVGLFVAPDDALLEAVLADVDLQAIQLHDVTPQRAQAIRVRFGRPVWRAVSVAGREDLPMVADPGVERLVLDAAPPKGSDLPGGNAVSFDWSLLRDWRAPQPWILAGGLTPANVAQAIRSTGATAVDVSSGVEKQRGLKDAGLIRDFVDQARRGFTTTLSA